MVGPVNRKIAFIIQARMASTRMPGKILLPMPFNSDNSIIGCIITELKKTKFQNDIIIATSKKKENDILDSFSKKHKVVCFRGSEENVLSRFIEISKKEKYTCIVRLTADNPIVDLKILEKTIAFHLKNKNDYTNTVNLPIGMNFEIISPNALQSIEYLPLTHDEKEHVTLYFKKRKSYKKSTFFIDINKDLSKLRLTIDYPSDYFLISTILSKANNRSIRLSYIEKIYNNFPWLFELNSKNFQKKQYSNTKDEIKDAYEILEYYGLNYSFNVLKKINTSNNGL